MLMWRYFVQTHRVKFDKLSKRTIYDFKTLNNSTTILNLVYFLIYHRNIKLWPCFGHFYGRWEYRLRKTVVRMFHTITFSARQQSFWSILLSTIEMQSCDHFVVISVVDESIDLGKLLFVCFMQELAQPENRTREKE